MNPSSLRAAMFSAALLVAGGLGAPCVRGASAPPTIQQQIDALLKHRLRPETLPVDLPNPFHVTSGGMREATVGGDGATLSRGGGSGKAVNPPAPTPADPLMTVSSAEILARCALQLRIGGVMRIKDQFQLVINDSPRKEGDFITADWNTRPVRLQIVHIAAGQLTLRLGDAELTLKF